MANEGMEVQKHAATTTNLSDCVKTRTRRFARTSYADPPSSDVEIEESEDIIQIGGSKDENDNTEEEDETASPKHDVA